MNTMNTMNTLNTATIATALVATAFTATFASKSQAAFVTEEYNNYTLQYQDDYATLSNSDILYFPETMTAIGGENNSISEATTLIFTPNGPNGFNITELSFFMDGDYTLSVMDGNATVVTTVFIRDLTEPTATPEIISFEEVITEEAEFGYWSTSGDLDTSNYQDTFSVTIQNFLSIDSTDSNSFIQTKYMAVSPIPIPASAWLFLSACTGLIIARRKN